MPRPIAFHLACATRSAGAHSDTLCGCGGKPTSTAQQAISAGSDREGLRIAQRSSLGRLSALPLLWRRPFGVTCKASRRSRAAGCWADRRSTDPDTMLEKVRLEFSFIARPDNWTSRHRGVRGAEAA